VTRSPNRASPAERSALPRDTDKPTPTQGLSPLERELVEAERSIEHRLAEIIEWCVKRAHGRPQMSLAEILKFGTHQILSIPTGQWRPVKPRSFALGQRIWAYQAGRQFEAWLVDHLDHGVIWMDEADSEPEPTHWRHLPTPPVEGEGS
jgi:hypothetical protein